MNVTQNTDILVVIVNYKTPALTIDALASLALQQNSNRNFRVVVTNAPAGDDSQERIAKAIKTQGWSSWIELVELERNGGFAYGNNAGIKPALEMDHPPKYVLLLNPDTVVREGAVDCLYDFLEANPNAGIVGS